MSLPEGRDYIKLGADLFKCVGYKPNAVPRPVTRNDIPGSPGDETLTPQVRKWRLTDWSGGEVGELNSFFDPQDPTAYDSGLCNPRVPGQLSGPPTRTGSTPAASTSAPTFGPFLSSSQGYIVLTHYQKIQYSSNGTTWTTFGSGSGGGSRETTCPTCSDGKYVYFANSDTPHGIGTIEMRRVNIDNAQNDQIVLSGANARDTLGIAVLGANLYRWTGAKLREIDLTSTVGWPLADGTLVYSAGGVDTANTFPTTYYGGACSTDNSVAMFYSVPGETTLYEYKAGVGTPLTSFLNGLTARAMCYYLGNLWIVGVFNAQAALFKYDLLTRQGSFVNFIGRGSSLTPVSCAPGPGDQVLIGMTTGEFYIYSKDLDAISELDVRTGDGTLNAVVAWKDQRCAAMGSTTVLKFSSWATDSATTTVSGNLTGSEWDGDLPEETKVLIGIRASFAPIAGTETITLSIKRDGASGFTDLTQITSATTGASIGNVLIPTSKAYPTTAVSWAAGSATYTIGAHYAVAGDTILTYGLAPEGLNGSFTVVSVTATQVLVTMSDPGTVTDQVGTLEHTVSFNTLRPKLAWTNGAIDKAVTMLFYPIGKDYTWELDLELSDNSDEDGSRSWQRFVKLFGTTSHTGTQAAVNGYLRANNVLTFLDGIPYPDNDGDYDTHTVSLENATYDAAKRVASVRLRSFLL